MSLGMRGLREVGAEEERWRDGKVDLQKEMREEERKEKGMA